MTAISFDEILTPANQDAIFTNVLAHMPAADRDALLDSLTPAERRDADAARARHSLRKRTAGRAWSTERPTRLIVTPDLTVTAVPCDHGGWQLWATEDLILAADGAWVDWQAIDLDRIDEQAVWATQAAAIEAICATI